MTIRSIKHDSSEIKKLILFIHITFISVFIFTPSPGAIVFTYFAISSLLFLVLDSKSGLLFYFVFAALSCILLQVCELFKFSVFSQVNSWTLWVAASAIAINFAEIDARRTIVIRFLQLTLMGLIPLFLLLQPQNIRIATFISGWDHTGAHAFIAQALKTNDTFRYLPADYIGDSPKLFHGIVNLLNINSTNEWDTINTIQFLDYLNIVVIGFAIIEVTKLIYKNNANIVISICAFSFLMQPLLLPWALQMGFSTMIYAAALTLACLYSAMNYRGPVLRLISIGAVITLSHTWTPLILVGLVIAFIINRNSRPKNIVTVIDAIIIFVFSILPVISIIQHKGLGTTLGVGDLQNSSILLLNVCILIAVLLINRSFFKEWNLLIYTLTSILASALIIKFYVSLNLLMFPYYSVKLLWVADVLLAILLVGQIVKVFRKSSYIVASISATAIAYLFFVGNMPYGAGSPFGVLLSPNDDQVWQVNAARDVYDNKEKSAVIYSSSANDSRGAQLLNLFGVHTWNAFDGLNSSPERLCSFLTSQPRAVVYSKLHNDFNCDLGDFNEILVE